MKSKIKLAALTAVVAFVSLAFFQARQSAQTQAPPAQPQTETAGQKFKNIKVLNDMPADQLGKVMNLMSASLNVKCDFCHTVDQWDKDGKKEKDTAREMLKMTFEINKAHFKGRPQVTCNSCHNGQHEPTNVPNLMPAERPERPAQPAVKPTADEIYDKYIAAIGGAANLAKIKSRSIKANRVEPDGKTTEAETIFFKDNKYAAATTYGKAVVTEGFDGTNAWKQGGEGPIVLKADEAEQIKREAELFVPTNLKAVYTKLDFRFVDRLDGRDVYFVLGTTASGIRERLVFDVQTGYLVRRSAATQTVLGNFIYQVDYADHKDFGGVKVPTKITYAMPAIRWTRTVTEVKNNASIDDAKFRKP